MVDRIVLMLPVDDGDGTNVNHIDVDSAFVQWYWLSLKFLPKKIINCKLLIKHFELLPSIFSSGISCCFIAYRWKSRPFSWTVFDT